MQRPAAKEEEEEKKRKKEEKDAGPRLQSHSQLFSLVDGYGRRAVGRRGPAMGGGTTGNFWDRSHSAEVRAVRQNAAVIARSRKFRGKVLRMQSAELIRQKH
jgi:hypothetical protein